jgi:ABC-2 type transport system ATP-binding protein
MHGPAPGAFRPPPALGARAEGYAGGVPGQGQHAPVPGQAGPRQHAPAPHSAPGATRRNVKLRVLGNPEAAAFLVRGGPGIVEVQVIGGVVHVGYLGNDTKIAEVVQHLVRNQIGVVGVEPDRNELERIFLEVTRGDAQ